MSTLWDAYSRHVIRYDPTYRFAYGLWFHLFNLVLYLVFLASLSGFVATYDYSHMRAPPPQPTAGENVTTAMPYDTDKTTVSTLVHNPTWRPKHPKHL